MSTAPGASGSSEPGATEGASSKPDPVVFIAHSEGDKGLVGFLCDLIVQALPDLRGKVFCTCLHESKLDSGDDFWKKIAAAIDACRVFVAVLTKDSIESRWVNQEIWYRRGRYLL